MEVRVSYQGTIECSTLIQVWRRGSFAHYEILSKLLLELVRPVLSDEHGVSVDDAHWS